MTGGGGGGGHGALVAVINGSGRDTGSAVGSALAAHGTAVVLVAEPGGDPAVERCAARITAAGGRARVEHQDVGLFGGAAALFSRVEQAVGPVDIVVNDVSSLHPVPLESLGAPEARRELDAHVKPTIALAKAALAHMRERGGGRIVNVVTDPFLGEEAGFAACFSAQGAVAGLTNCTAAEGASSGIAANLVRVRPAAAAGGRLSPAGLALLLARDGPPELTARSFGVRPPATVGDAAAEAGPLVRLGSWAPEEIAGRIPEAQFRNQQVR